MKKPLQPRKPATPEVLQNYFDRDSSLRTIRCVICASDTQAESPENMCWVCRRLKISAWRDVEQQIPSQE